MCCALLRRPLLEALEARFAGELVGQDAAQAALLVLLLHARLAVLRETCRATNNAMEEPGRGRGVMLCVLHVIVSGAALQQCSPPAGGLWTSTDHPPRSDTDRTDHPQLTPHRSHAFKPRSHPDRTQITHVAILALLLQEPQAGGALVHGISGPSVGGAAVGALVRAKALLQAVQAGCARGCVCVL